MDIFRQSKVQGFEVSYKSTGIGKVTRFTVPKLTFLSDGFLRGRLLGLLLNSIFQSGTTDVRNPALIQKKCWRGCVPFLLDHPEVNKVCWIIV